MEFTCPICASNQFTPKIICTDYTVSKEKFNIVSCNNCELWQTFPFPEEENIEKYYQSIEYISHSDKKDTFFDKLYHLVRNYTLIQKVNLVKKYVPHGTILDIGCGTGYFLEECQKNKFNVYGIEPSSEARDLAISKNHKVYENIDSVMQSNLNFDVITMWHVLEHLYNPGAFVNTLYNMLNNNSYAIIAVPNRNSFDAQHYKEFWAGYDVPRHLFHYTKKDIHNLFHQKFSLIKIYPMYFDSFYVSILSEKYKENNIPFVRGLFWGLISNLSALSSGEYSSLIYVFQKK